jgi:hypothetical protein
MQAAIDRNRTRGDWRHDLALLHWGQSQVAQKRGDDPVPHYRAAIAEHSRALTGDTHGESGPILVNRGKARVSLGYYLLNQRHDPTAELTAAIEDFRLVRNNFPGLTDADIFEAEAFAGLARHANRPAGDPTRSVDERIAAYGAALQYYRRASEVAPTRAELRVELGGAGVNFGGYLAGAKRDPDAVWAKAIDDLGSALEIDPHVPRGRLFRGNAHTAIARHRARTQRTFVDQFRNGFADYRVAVAQAAAPAVAERLAWAASLIELGSLLQHAGRDAQAELDEAITLLEPVVTAAPGTADGWRYRGLAQTALLQNHIRIHRRESGHAALAAAAKADLEQAISLHPGFARGFAGYLRALDAYLATHGK